MTKHFFAARPVQQADGRKGLAERLGMGTVAPSTNVTLEG